MGFRFRKVISVLPGVKINLSKSRVSTSLGGKGATVNVGPDGKPAVTVGLPGTGMSYRAPLTGVVFVALIAAVVIVGLAYLIAPDAVRGLLHWWQPRWF